VSKSCCHRSILAVCFRTFILPLALVMGRQKASSLLFLTLASSLGYLVSGGYIFAKDGSLKLKTPPENIATTFDAVYEGG